MEDEEHIPSVGARTKWAMNADGLRISFENLRLTLETKANKRKKVPATTKVILNDVSGTIRPGRLSIIIGPSGSGKTSLLHTLAGRTKSSKGLELTGKVLVNNAPISWNDYRRQIAYVEQEDLLFGNLTVRETLMLAMELRMPAEMSLEEKNTFVESVMADLGIIHVADSIVGDARKKSISGGEKRRCSIAVELLSSPKGLYLDEPTSGLDANASLSVMQLLSQLAASGRSVIASVHQPRSQIFSLAQDLFLLAKGELAFFGPTQEFLSFLESLGQPCPAHFNPADFAIDLVSMDYRTAEAQKESAARIRKLTQGYSTSTLRQASLRGSDLIASPKALLTSSSPSKNGHLLPVISGVEETTTSAQNGSRSNGYGEVIPSAEDDPMQFSNGNGASFVANSASTSNLKNRRYQASWGKQFYLLLQRASRNRFRSKAGLFIPVILAILFGLILGSLNFQLSTTQKAIQNRIGLLFFVTLNQSFNALLPVLTTFGGERAIVLRERVAKSYHVSAYFFSKTLIDVPFSVLAPWVMGTIIYFMVGLNPNVDRFFIFLLMITLAHFTSVSLGLMLAAGLSPSVASSVGAPIMLILMLFAGFYSNIDLIPPAIAWIQYISPIRWAFSAVVINEFSGVTYQCNPESGLVCVPNGEYVIRGLSFENDSVARSVVILCGFIVVLQFMAYLILRYNKPKYLVPKTSSSSPPAGDASKNEEQQHKPEAEIAVV